MGYGHGVWVPSRVSSYPSTTLMQADAWATYLMATMKNDSELGLSGVTLSGELGGAVAGKSLLLMLNSFLTMKFYLRRDHGG